MTIDQVRRGASVLKWIPAAGLALMLVVYACQTASSWQEWRGAVDADRMVCHQAHLREADDHELLVRIDERVGRILEQMRASRPRP